MNTALANLLEVFLSLDKVIYNLIAVIYKLIVDLAEYQVFDSKDIEEFSNRVYALVGIFMLFKITFSMIVYLVNPDEFSDKSKGFGSLIKNVIISMVLIVAVPYIFNEAFYVQKMILHDGTIAKIVFGNGIKDSSANIDQPGKELKFILFSQFVKPNSDDYAQLAVCDELFTYDADGKISNSEESTEEGEGTSKTVKHHEINETCKTALKCAFDGNKEGDSCEETDNYLYYVKGMENSEFGLLTSDSDVFTYSANTKNKSQSNYKQPVIAYRWGVSTIIGIIVTLILITICLDVAVRSIKLGFYQIIAPIPILSNCDPKASKNGMLQKWAKACVETYLDLFLRLLGLFLGMKLIVALTDNTKFQGFASVVIVIGALMFAKQLPKILQDLTGLKLDGKFTLNPFKKIKNEIPEGLSKGLEKARMRATGAAGGFLAGVVGGGNKFGERMLAGAMGTARGAVKGKGFAAGLSAQADSNRKMRDARIAGATFWGGVGAGAASVFGLDKAHLEAESKRIRSNKDAIDKAYRTQIEPQTNELKTRKKGIQDSIAGKKKRRGQIDANKTANNSLLDISLKNVSEDAGKGGALFKKLEADKGRLEAIKNGTGVWHRGATAEGPAFTSSDADQNDLSMYLQSIESGHAKVVFDGKSNRELLVDNRTGQVLASRWTEQSYSEAAAQLSNDKENAKLDYTTGMIKIIEAKKAGVTITDDMTFKGEDGTEIKLTDINGGKVDATFETAYEKKLMNDKQLKEEYKSVVPVDGEYYYVNDQGEREQLTGREKEYYEKYIIGSLDFDEKEMSIGKQIKSRGGAAKGTVEIMAAELDPQEAEIAKIDDTIVHLETTTIVDGLVDEHGKKVTGEAATYAKAKDQNAKDDAAQKAKIAESDVMHKGYEASKITK